MNYRHQAMLQKACVVISIFGIWTVLSGLTPIVRAQSVTNHTSNMLSKGNVNLLKRGLVLYELGDGLGALWDFDDAIVRNPHHARAYFHRAGLRLSLGYRSGAMQDLRLAAKLFSEQGDKARSQKAQNLLRHFNIR